MPPAPPLRTVGWKYCSGNMGGCRDGGCWLPKDKFSGASSYCTRCMRRQDQGRRRGLSGAARDPRLAACIAKLPPAARAKLAPTATLAHARVAAAAGAFCWRLRGCSCRGVRRAALRVTRLR
jgi:hypothetical protein